MRRVAVDVQKLLIGGFLNYNYITGHMTIIIITLLIEILWGFLFVDKTQESEYFSIYCIVITSVSMMLFIIWNYGKYQVMIMLAYLLRLFLLFADYYHLIPIIHSGADSEMFHRVAVAIMETNSFDVGGLDYLSTVDSSNVNIMTNYPKIVGALYILIGPQRLFVQFLNVILGMVAIHYVYKTFLVLCLSGRVMRFFLFLMCFLPHEIIFSAILLREMMIGAAISISIYYIIKWFEAYNFVYFVVAGISILFGAWLHSGVFGIFVGYLFALSFYDYREKKLRFGGKSTLGGIFALLLFVYLVNTGLFTDYFSHIIEAEDEQLALNQYVNHSTKAESAYLTWLNIDSPRQLLLFSPLKILYFLFSPMPWDMRGFNDMLAFCLSSLFYILLFGIIIIKYRHIRDRQKKNIIKVLLVSFFLTAFIYGYGCFAAGPAMRHRTKLFPVLLVAAAMTYNCTKPIKNKKNIW